MKLISIAVVSISLLCLLIWIGGIFYLFRGWFHRFYHDILEWHQPDNQAEWSDGLSSHATCKWCKKDIMQDGQGNWF